MEINFDKEADAVYVRFREGKSASTKKIDDLTIVDLDKKGNILGIEVLNATERIPKESLSSVHVKNLIVAQR